MDDFSLLHHHIPKHDHGSLQFKDTKTKLCDARDARSGSYLSHDDFIRVPKDQHIRTEVHELAERYRSSSLKFVLVVGIGGSNLGSEAIVDALSTQTSGVSEVLYFDTTSLALMEKKMARIIRDIHAIDEVLIILISKSGTTAETIANGEYIIGSLSSTYTDVMKRVVCITDEGSPMWNYAEKHNLSRLPLPKLIGGRYSVFTPAGLFPLAVAGYDIEQLCSGAHAVAETLASTTGRDLATIHANAIYNAHRDGARMINFFFFHPELESLGKWSRQLYAESLGKMTSRGGKTIHAGITPIVSIGSTDLHSMAQLYFAGPRDKFTVALFSPQIHARYSTTEYLGELHASWKTADPQVVMKAIYSGVLSAYNDHELPFAEIIAPQLNLYTIGAYMMMEMITVVLLSTLLDVNPYDQPNVEDYKKFTRTHLEK